jgi:3-phosphoshikimate 1-carboxyvinyltransferase
MTSELIKAFPHGGGTFQIEPDASSGGYFLAADWVQWVALKTTEMGRITVKHWPTTAWQIDQNYSKYYNLTELQGYLSRKTHLGDSIMMAIAKAPLNPSPSPDQMILPDSPIQPAFSKPIEFRDLGRLRLQETERVHALKTELTRCGARVEEDGDTLRVYSDYELTGPSDGIETYNDHRMAMCFAVLGLKVSGIRLRNPACVKKTFPNFFQKLAAEPPHGLGVKIRDVRADRELTHDELFAD